MRQCNEKLQRFYRLANRRYWRGRLPANVIIRWDAKLYRKERAIGIFQNFPGIGVFIRVSTLLRYSRGLVGLIILHEMCHLAVFLRNGDARYGHGTLFQAEMLRLAKAGAFAELW